MAAATVPWFLEIIGDITFFPTRKIDREAIVDNNYIILVMKSYQAKCPWLAFTCTT